MKLKQIIALLLALVMGVVLVSCGSVEETTTGKAPVAETTSAPVGTNETTTGSSSEKETTSFEPEETTTTVTPPPAVAEIADHQRVSVGDYVTLVYNEMTCTVATEVKQALGSKQTVTMTVTMKDGFTFDGFSVGAALVNAGKVAESSLTYKFDVSDATMVYVNTSMTVVYHANGGVSKNGQDTLNDNFSLVFYHNPSTLPENGYFTRDGYTLVCYNTEADGSGVDAYLGNRIDANGAAVLDLYCVWAQNTDESKFTVSGSKITSYTGEDEIVVIPEKIGGKTIQAIDSGAFKDATLKTVVVAKSVKEISKSAFQGCRNLETVVIFDGVTSFSEASFSGCMVRNLRVNAQHTMWDTWQNYGSVKLDRLMWAKDKKKVVIVGGSGSYYGFDSVVLDKALEGYEIINFGENANCSAVVYFDIIEEFLGEGDILLWAPEPGTNTLGSKAVGYRLMDFRQNDLGFLQYVDLSYYADLMANLGNMFNSLNGAKFKNYDCATAGTNKYGDNCSDRKTNNGQYDYSNEFRASRRIEALAEMSEIAERITEKGAHIYFTYAAMQASGMKNLTDEIMADYEKRLQELPGLVVISDYKNCGYDNDMFYDSAWHMVAKGATLRSERVAADLVAQMQKDGLLPQ